MCLLINTLSGESMHQIIQILERYRFKGKYVNEIKKQGFWSAILENTDIYEHITDTERVYLFLNPSHYPICESSKQKRFKGVTLGYSDFCTSYLKCDTCKSKFILKQQSSFLNKYGVDNPGKLDNAKKGRQDFWKNAEKVNIANEKRKSTITEKFGVDNIFKRTDLIEIAMIDKHGVKNPGLMVDHVEKIKKTSMLRYGIEWASQTHDAISKRKNTNIEKFGVEFPMQLQHISEKAITTKILTGGFTKSNSSKEATMFIRQYVQEKQYELGQCAFADIEYGLHEWGLYHNGKWVLYDLVVFEKGYRGDKTKIIEILEYHGPFHYTAHDVEVRGHTKAYPWKSSSTTISESVRKDEMKEELAKELTVNYNIIWAKDIK